MVAKAVESPGDFLRRHPRLAEFLSIRFRLLVPPLTVEVVLRPLGLKTQRSEKNETHPHFPDTEVTLAARVPVLISREVYGYRHPRRREPRELWICHSLSRGMSAIKKGLSGKG